MHCNANPRKKGIHAIRIYEDDKLLDVALTDGKKEVMLATTAGMAIRFSESAVRSMGRGAAGVRGIRIKGDHSVVGMVCVSDTDKQLLILSENGYGKRSRIKDYRLTNRGVRGVKTLSITPKTGTLVAIKLARKEDEFVIMNKSGVMIRTAAKQLRIISRATQGVRVIRLNKSDAISAVAMVPQFSNKNTAESGDMFT